MPDTTVELLLRVQRDPALSSQALQIALIVPSHFKGIAAEPVRVPAGKNEATLRVRIGPRLGTFNMPATIRVTTVNAPTPHTAETTIEFVAYQTAQAGP